MRSNIFTVSEGGQPSTTRDMCPIPVSNRTTGMGSASVPDLRERIVRHCSPTLAGLKCGSMFRVESDLHGISDQLMEIRELVQPRGVRIAFLRCNEDEVLIYIYRPGLLQDRVALPGVMDFLSGYGYTAGSAPAMVAQLAERFVHCTSMPPEVGIFLDYPLEDVRGYIENEGRCSRCIGCWKVYGDVEVAERRFNSYRKCREVFTRRFHEGSCISRLAIRA